MKVEIIIRVGGLGCMLVLRARVRLRVRGLGLVCGSALGCKPVNVVSHRVHLAVGVLVAVGV